MFGGHIWELAIILGLALVVFGPKRLPEIGGALGKGIREFKQSTSELSDSITSSHEAQSPVPVAVPVAVAPQAGAMHTAAYESEGSPVPAPVPYTNAG
jgi:TatA/E family protein of Tat protein translocase